MSKTALTQWGWKHLGPTAQRVVGREGVTPYTFRHSHASALHYCQMSETKILRRLGHSAQVHYAHYAHVIDSLEDKPRHASLDALIAHARQQLAAPDWRREVGT
jgi:integrase